LRIDLVVRCTYAPACNMLTRSIARERLVVRRSDMPQEEYESSTDRILVINCGSSSLKFALYFFSSTGSSLEPERGAYSGSVERIGEPSSFFQVSGGLDGRPGMRRSIPVRDHTNALSIVLDWLSEQTSGDLPTAVGHRIVHGGSSYEQPQLITDDVISTLSGLEPLAPLHLPIEVAAIETLRARYPSMPQVACFDTAFHRTMPRVAQLYGLPRRFLDAGLLRYGFHGLSYEYIMSTLIRESADTGQQLHRQRLVIAHLGNGASMVAVASGHSIDTTMGLTPIGGLVMSTRSGDLDPGVLLYLLESQRMTPAELRQAVEQHGGLLGVSNSSPDMQVLLSQREQNQPAAEAVELFAYTARKHLGALVAALGGLDALIFTGGIGEHSAEVRQAICEGMSYIGIQLDPERNAGGASIISAPQGPVMVRVIPTNEEIMIARHTRSVLHAAGQAA
jgi:acetate kinase